MSRGSWLLFLSIATVPLSAYPFGLGDIHVDSDLNQPLAARIELVGASAEELVALSAAVANREAFLRAGAERPAFLSSITFKVTKDAEGRSMLAVRSTDPFTDPLVSLLVDLRWPRGELIREYTLMLDPADASFRSRLAAATQPTHATDADVALAPRIARPVPLSAPIRHVVQSSSSTLANDGAHRHVVANASLRRLARRTGARGRTDVHRMMLAIYRANPTAFDGSITRLHRGTTLVIPTRAEAAVIPRGVAEREYQAQLRAARAGQATRSLAAAAPPTQAPDASSMPLQSPPDALIPVEAAAQATPTPIVVSAIDTRVRSLEKSIDELKSMLASEHAKFLWLQTQAAAQAPAVVAAAPKSLASAVTPLAAVLGFLLGLTAALRWRSTRTPAASKIATAPFYPIAEPNPIVTRELHDEATAELPVVPAPTAPVPRASVKITPRSSPPVPGISVVENGDMDILAGLLPEDPKPQEITIDTTVEVPPPKPVPEATFVYGGETTAVLAVDPEELFGETVVGMENVKLDYNLTELDTTAQHVSLPSELTERAHAEEQRTDITHVLRQAIERDPHRRDLQMKLLEVYFAHMAKDKFMALADKLAQNRETLTSIDWQKVLMMGRQIAPDEPLFKGDGTRAEYAA